MKNFFKGFAGYLKNMWEAFEVVILMTATWFVIFIAAIIGSIAGKMPFALWDHMFIDFFQKCADVCRNARQKQIDESIKSLPEENE